MDIPQVSSAGSDKRMTVFQARVYTGPMDMRLPNTIAKLRKRTYV